MPAASPRLAWAVETLDVQPDDRLLELGCGHGVAVSSICERLGPDGLVVGLDRSATMTAAAERRAASHVTAGRARFITAPLHEADLGDDRFTKVLAVHFPPLLRGDPARELAVVADHLERGGTLHVVAQPLAADAGPATTSAIVATLERHGFAVREIRTERIGDRPMVSVVAGVEPAGIEPATSCLQSRRSPS